jgi:hypothetical protein
MTAAHSLFRVFVVFLVCANPHPARAQNHFGSVSASTQVGDALSDFSPDTLQYFVKALSGEVPIVYEGASVTLPHRYAGNGSLPFRQAAGYIFGIFERYGLNPMFENNPYMDGYDRINVVGTLPGTGGAYVILCGHFDSANLNCPGADDNASGVAAVLEAARVLRNSSCTYGIKFIAFGGEEEGLLGSIRYARDHASDSIVAVLNADMIMWDGNGDRTVQLHARDYAFSADLAQYIAAVGDAYSLPARCLVVLPGTTASDHASFWNNPPARSAVLFIEEYAAPQDFNPYYHTANDNWAHVADTRHQDFFAAVTRLFIASGAHVAGMRATSANLTAFTGRIAQGVASLSWRTAAEIGVTGFDVLRSTDNDRPIVEARWTRIGTVPASGASTGQEYSFADTLSADIASAPLVHYRLKELDRDGRQRYSHVVSLPPTAAPGSLIVQSMYPNPVSSSATVQFLLTERQPVTVAVYNSLGERVLLAADREPLEAGYHRVTIPAASLAAGAYFCRVSTPAATAHRTFVKLRK